MPIARHPNPTLNELIAALKAPSAVVETGDSHAPCIARPSRTRHLPARDLFRDRGLPAPDHSAGGGRQVRPAVAVKGVAGRLEVRSAPASRDAQSPSIASFDPSYH